MIFLPNFPHPMDQFNKLTKGYSKFVDEDPMRQVHYAAVLKELSGVQNSIQGRTMQVLDEGTGTGNLAIKVASELGASVLGFDSAPGLIAFAQEQESKNALGIEYQVAAAHEFTTDRTFDAAMSVLVLPYAPDEEYLTEFFRSASQALPAGGRFISVIFNPKFTAFGERIGNRIFDKSDDGRIEVHFLDPVTLQRAFKKDEERVFLTQFSQEQYEESSLKGGFRSVQWDTLHPSQEQIEKLGKGFWEKFEQEQPYALLIAQK